MGNAHPVAQLVRTTAARVEVRKADSSAGVGGHAVAHGNEGHRTLGVTGVIVRRLPLVGNQQGGAVRRESNAVRQRPGGDLFLKRGLAAAQGVKGDDAVGLLVVVFHRHRHQGAADRHAVDAARRNAHVAAHLDASPTSQIGPAQRAVQGGARQHAGVQNVHAGVLGVDDQDAVAGLVPGHDFGHAGVQFLVFGVAADQRQDGLPRRVGHGLGQRRDAGHQERQSAQ